MNTNKIKTYAPKARRDFIAAVTRRAAKFGLTAKGTSPVREEGQLVFIEGQPYPRSVGAQRAKLAARIQQQGFQQVMEAAAYTWFNRFAAIRFMELHGYLDHSFRVLSPSPLAGEGRGEGASSTGLPEILEQAQHVDLPGLDRQRVIELKMDGTRDEELYRDLLLAQCRALHQAMPFLFESVDDETELLLPENLLQTDSLIRELVTAIPEDDWREIEIIGWLYQFYISEKKDQVIGKVVKSEDIPAATQLFTPNWIVKYMVQNSLGAQWLATYPDSPLKGQMAYYIEPAEQTDEVKAQLAAITPDSLNPEELTLIDPACGSGHILVEAYELFKAIYLERGYRQRDVTRLILEKNLFGLDIDGRAAQLTGFALMMKGRADDRRLLDRGVTLNVMALQESKGLDADELTRALESVVGPVGRVSPQGVTRQSNAEFGVDDLFPGTLPQMRLGESETAQKSGDAALTRLRITALIETFAEAKTFGSLIQIAPELATALPELEGVLSQALEAGDAFAHAAAVDLLPLVRQARILAMQFDAVVANPPYMGRKYMTKSFRAFAEKRFTDVRHDVFAMFIPRMHGFCKFAGFLGLMTPFTWLSINSYEKMRRWIVKNSSLRTLIQPELHAFFDSAFVSICAFTLQKITVPQEAIFIDLSEFYGEDLQAIKSLEAIKDDQCSWRFHISPIRFIELPTCQFTFQLSESFFRVFKKSRLVSEYADVKEGLNTGDNEKFFRMWWEISLANILINSSREKTMEICNPIWIPCNRGGPFRRWYGNNESVIEWSRNGFAIKTYCSEDGKILSAVRNERFYFKPGITWSGVSSGNFHARAFESGFIFNSVGRSMFPHANPEYLLGFLNSPVCNHLLKTLAPTIHFSVGNIANLPVAYPEDKEILDRIVANVKILIQLTKKDWDSQEISLASEASELIIACADNVEQAFNYMREKIAHRRNELREREQAVNLDIIDIHELSHALSHLVDNDSLTIKDLSSEEWIRRFISYAIGCMMGRYSLDAPGLIYAHSGNQGFDPSRYARFPADADGILPITDTDWFDEDATHRLVEFIAAAWDQAHLEENLSFLADNLSPKNDESSRETIRRYLSDRFFKDHLQTYKNRPIYWCFSSGKQKAFQCLVYLHRYNEGTLARMRMEYLVPLQSKMAARIDKFGDDIQAASSSAQAKRLQKERDKLTRQLEELRRYDEQLRHYADQRIALDLDDGVKVNYAKFGNLLAEVKTVTGRNPD